LTGQSGINDEMFRFHLFGEYDSPNFEFWDAAETAELTDNYQALDTAPNSEAYSDFIAFKIKNTDSATHSYTVTVVALKYGGDSIISNYFTLSDDDGATKESSLAISNLTASSFSDELRIYADISAANNPADGYHYYYAKIVETA
jgi:hypothetical protein